MAHPGHEHTKSLSTAKAGKYLEQEHIHSYPRVEEHEKQQLNHGKQKARVDTN